VQGCLAFDDMQDFCAWVGGRLPTESEWEYAARNRGAVRNPWGDEPINGVQERANIGEYTLGWGAGQNPCTAAPLGITQQGVCDLIGNVDEVVLDTWSEDYVGHPKDGSAWTAGGSDRVCRGGGFRHAEVDDDGVPISGTWRHPCGGTLGAVDTKRIDRGFRCVR
jgi:formylglycine-generating enzyme required for sulfatase activity